MSKEIKVEAKYHDDLERRVRLYVLALIELARQRQAEDEAEEQKTVEETEGGDAQPEVGDDG